MEKESSWESREEYQERCRKYAAFGATKRASSKSSNLKQASGSSGYSAHQGTNLYYTYTKINLVYVCWNVVGRIMASILASLEQMYAHIWTVVHMSLNLCEQECGRIPASILPF
jgi:hypothetical protein